jgi:uncharacterized protein YjbJ (UPF0337 family)
MDNDRIAGAAKQAKGAVREAAGKVTGDAKLKADGKRDKVEGKVLNAMSRSRPVCTPRSPRLSSPTGPG